MRPISPFRPMLLAFCLAGTSSLWAADAASTPAKKELIAKLVQLQAPLAEGIAQSIIQRAVSPLVQGSQMAIQQLPQDKREATAKAMEAEIKKFVDDNVAYLKDKAAKTVPATSSALLEERFNEDELRQLLTWMESPINKKLGQFGMDLQRGVMEKLMTEAAPTLDGRMKTLQQSLAKQLGQSVSGTAGTPAPSKPAASAPAKK